MAVSHKLDDTWISATSVHHYMMMDPLLDWLDYHSKSHRLTNVTTKNNKTVSYIMNQGHMFEAEVVKSLKHKFGAKVAEVVTDNVYSGKAIKETLALMKRGVPIIHGGVVANNSDKTFGITDLLVRSDWLQFLVDTPVKIKNKNKGLFGAGKGHYHYVVVDIKYTCLLLRADGQHLLNSGLFPAYKAQLLIYNRALGSMQGYTPEMTYILGRRCVYQKFNVKYSDDYCFSRLGVIDYSTVDRSFVTTTDAAIAWIKEVRCPASAEWNVTKYPLERWELYPNMCNTYDYPWRPYKEKLAESQAELTSMWMVGPRNRQIALAAGICKWTDKRCNPVKLGIKGPKVGSILTSILDINQQTKDLLRPRYVQNNFGQWKSNNGNEFFIDFETTNGAFEPLIDELGKESNFPYANVSDIVYMIGIGHQNVRTKKWTYVNYTINAKQDETAIFGKMVEYINARCKNPKVYHWGNAEMVKINKNWDPEFRRGIDNWTFVDMLRIFKEEPIVIKGCKSFGLKDVAKTLHKNGKIQTIWNGMGCQDGENAMIIPYTIGLMQGKKVRPWSVIAYNEVDVKVLFEILEYLRREHCDEQVIKKGKKRVREESTSRCSKRRRV